jgi:hypothetical protein
MHFGVTWVPTLINNLGKQVINCEQKTYDIRNCNVFIVLGFHVCTTYPFLISAFVYLLLQDVALNPVDEDRTQVS